MAQLQQGLLDVNEAQHERERLSAFRHEACPPDTLSARKTDTQNYPNSQVYGFCDAQGMFHAFEGPEGKRMMMAFKALEEKILAKVERSLAGMHENIEQTEKKLSIDIMPMIESLAEEQKDLSNKVNEISMESFESRSDLIAQIDEISREALESRIDCLASLEELQIKMDNTMDMKDLECLEMQLDQDMDIQADFDFHSAQKDDHLETLLAEVRALGQNQTAQSAEQFAPSSQAASDEKDQATEQKHTTCDADFEDWTPPKTLGKTQTVDSAKVIVSSSRAASDQSDEATKQRRTACDLDLSDEAFTNTQDKGNQPHEWLQWARDHNFNGPDGRRQSSPAGALYSSKQTSAEALGRPFEKKPVPFAHGFNIHRPRPTARLASCQSMPLLAPLY